MPGFRNDPYLFCLADHAALSGIVSAVLLIRMPMGFTSWLGFFVSSDGLYPHQLPAVPQNDPSASGRKRAEASEKCHDHWRRGRREDSPSGVHHKPVL